MIFSHSMQAGYGSGTTRCLCERPIQPQHIEYEVTDDRDGRQLSFHFAVWQLECRAWSLAREGQTNRSARHE